jgi:hypothetical protein
MDLSRMNRLRFAFVKSTYRTYTMLLKILPCALHTSSDSTGFAKQIRSSLLILCYNGSLITWTVVSLTAAKSGFALSYAWNIFSWFCTSSTCCLHNFVISINPVTPEWIRIGPYPVLALRSSVNCCASPLFNPLNNSSVESHLEHVGSHLSGDEILSCCLTITQDMCGRFIFFSRHL